MSRDRYRVPARGRVRRALIKCVELLCWIVAGLALGIFAYIHANAYLFQLDQNRRVDALLRRRAEAEVVSTATSSAAADKTELASSRAAEPAAVSTSAYYAAPGDLLGRIEIPRLQVSAVIVEGVDTDTLERAVGHIPGTALPGETGNIALAGHRDSFFRKIGKLHDGDEIVLVSIRGTFKYHVSHIGIVTPSDTTVLAPSQQPALTLVTCFPFRYIGPAPDRYIITAR
jgi:sortase A